MNNTLPYKTLDIRGYVVHHYDMVDSTSIICQKDLYQKSGYKMAIIANDQEAGRGRLGSTWQSMRGNLMTTVILPLQEEKSVWSDFSFITALAVSDCVSMFLDNTKVEIKWPNDVLVNGAKISGVLLEAYEHTLCIGVGINVLSAPIIGKYNTTCLSSLGADVDKNTLLNILLERIDVWHNALKISGLEGILPIYRVRLMGVDKKILIRTLQENHCGVFKGVDDTGQAVLELTDGDVKKLTAGEISFE